MRKIIRVTNLRHDVRDVSRVNASAANDYLHLAFRRAKGFVACAFRLRSESSHQTASDFLRWDIPGATLLGHARVVNPAIRMEWEGSLYE